MYCSTAQTPRFYALLKTHKENYPIRPIVSFIGSPTYQISKYLSKILTPFTNLANQKLKNSYQIREILSEMSISSDDVLVSYDVKSLFTSIPLDLARESVKLSLENHPQLLSQITSLTCDDILGLLDLCFSGAVF